MVKKNPEANGSSDKSRWHAFSEIILPPLGAAAVSTAILAGGAVYAQFHDDDRPPAPAGPPSVCGPTAHEEPDLGFDFPVGPMMRSALRGEDGRTPESTGQEWDELAVWIEEKLDEQDPPKGTTYKLRVKLDYSGREDSARLDADSFAAKADAKLPYDFIPPATIAFNPDNDDAAVSVIACVENK